MVALEYGNNHENMKESSYRWVKLIILPFFPPNSVSLPLTHFKQNLGRITDDSRKDCGHNL